MHFDALSGLPERFADVAALEDFMSAPDPALAAHLERAPGDSWCSAWAARWARRSRAWRSARCPARRVIGVARFSEAGLREKLEAWGSSASNATCSIAQRSSACRAPNVVFMAGFKFGAPETRRSPGR
jgi:hypothetical protein